MHISLILAVAQNGVIGQQDGRHGLPWDIPQDLAWFRQHTLHQTIIMGRRTHELMGRPLPKRHNIVLTRDNHTFTGCQTAHSWSQALDMAVTKDIFIIGGATLFEQAWEMAERCYLTRVLAEVNGDTSWEPPHWDDWVVVQQLQPEQGPASHPFEHTIYQRRWSQARSL